MMRASDFKRRTGDHRRFNIHERVRSWEVFSGDHNLIATCLTKEKAILVQYCLEMLAEMEDFEKRVFGDKVWTEN